MKASKQYKVYKNEGGQTISTIDQPIIEKDGLYFKDLDRSGELKVFSDWRNEPAVRAQALVDELGIEEKIGQLFVTSRNPFSDKMDEVAMLMARETGQEQEKRENKSDETGLLDENVLENVSIFAGYRIPGTTESINQDMMRNFILRSNVEPAKLTDWLNQLQKTAENNDHFIPVLVTTNSRNENGKVVFGMNDSIGTFPTWPGTLGIGAAIVGTKDKTIAKQFGEAIRKEWNAAGLKKGYMYMADVVTDPRWQRIYGTFGEHPQLIADIFEQLVPAIQGSKEGVTSDGVALTVKHWPGGGARENGFDPHYKEGQWNVYATEDSLMNYHTKGFVPAIEYGAASIMPYYAKPSKEKSAIQHGKDGKEITWIPKGFAFNSYMIRDLLRNQFGYKGYINSDSGIIDNMGWGVEELDRAERIALAINTGVDMISESYGVEYAKEAVARRTNGYYDTHPIPNGYTLEQITLDEEAISCAAVRTLTEKFALGMFDDPYRDPQNSEEVITKGKDWQTAYSVHQQSIVLLKNKGVLGKEDLQNKKIFIQGFDQTKEAGQKWTETLREELAQESVQVTNDYNEADIAIVMVSPESGNYFTATKGLLEIDLCEEKTVADFSEEGLPLETTHSETTVAGIGEIQTIANAVHAHGGKVIATINITMPWMVGNLEPHCDVLMAGFNTYTKAFFDVIFNRFAPVGKLPLTLPKNDEVIAVDAQGICITPNDLPGYEKDTYLPKELKDENGKGYAYKDEDGNYYEYGFGLSLH